PTFSATDVNLDSTTATLDGVSFASGTTVSSEGEHTLVVTASDRAGNSASQTLQFTIDTTAPAISISGVSDGQLGNQPVTPTFSATDVNLDSTTATLDGASFASGATVSSEGEHTLVVTATDRAGNSSSETVRFEIDTAAPAISIAGVSDGQLGSQPVTPIFSATDSNLDSTTATLDGVSFASGTTVASEGEHTLVVTATDRAGNSASQTVHFGIDTTAPAISISGVSDGQLG
ncbi:MAG TPA: hypothetical protein DFS52_03525, partial [Myxococcales bacterium]|nr:hypothetical protein [Myxococcales bacterium]